MIYSMTGFGRAQWQDPLWRVNVEIRSVNQRGLKITLRGPDAGRAREPELETLIKEKIARGHIFAAVTCEPSEAAAEAIVDETRLHVYLKLVENLLRKHPSLTPPSAAALLDLPDVIKREPLDEAAFERIWPDIRATAAGALDRLIEMRRTEGANLHTEFQDICGRLDGRIGQIAARAPTVIAEYRGRLFARAQQLLDGTMVTVSQDDLHREVALFADRSDISEELARLRSHIKQFLDTIEGGGPVGRKLEFLTQEMFREANTTASKANDSQIIHLAVDIKTDIERLREQVFNIE